MGGWADEPSWYLIVDPAGRSGVENMAADVALLDDAVRLGTAALRLYRWDPPTLSLGRNQPNTFDDVPTVRRPTGGQAVWHEHEVTYAVAAPIAVFGSLRKAYCEIHTRLASALRTLGVEAVLAPAPQPTRPSAKPASCFASSVGGEILVSGRKLVGSAQVRRGDAFLQHGSILLDGSQQTVSPMRGETTLAAVLGRVVTFAEVTSAIVDNWSEALAARPSLRE
ncbi:MAG: biotin/lipoate A/B protein ligase family protein [Gemmatimonadales bacterium]